MGNKAVEITYGASSTYLSKGDTLRSGRDRDLMDVAGSELDFFKQKISQVTGDVSRTLDNLNAMLERNGDNIAGTLGHLNTLSGDMAEVLSAEKHNLRRAMDSFAKFSEMLGENAGRVDSIILSLNGMAQQLSEEEVAAKIARTVDGLNVLMERLKAGEGTVGKLLDDPALYDSLTVASGNLAALLSDVKQYPGRYVHFSLFGRDPEKAKAKADRKAARAAEKARQDSLSGKNR